MTTWVFDDGGRKAAGFKGTTGDCCTRAIAIATGMTYREVYDLVNEYGRRESTPRHPHGKRSAARLGPPIRAVRRLLGDLGWVWVPTMRVGQGTTVHLDGAELPGGRIIARVSGHLAAVVDGVVRDTFDCSRGGRRCVYGYWTAPDREFSSALEPAAYPVMPGGGVSFVCGQLGPAPGGSSAGRCWPT